LRALYLQRGQGAQERSVPVKSGWSPDASEGGHSTQAGAPLGGAVVAVAEDPLEIGPEGDVAPAVPIMLERAAEPPPPDAAPATDPVPELPGEVVPEAG
jgi:hypothetical protein